MDIKIYIARGNDRQDVFDLFCQCIDRFWKNHPEIIGNTRPEKMGWSEFLLEETRKINNDFILLTLDDNIIYENVCHETIMGIIEYMKKNCEIKIAKFESVNYPPTIKLSSLNNFALFDDQPPYYKKTLLHPSIYRKDYLIYTLEKILQKLTPLHDEGWVGSYNFELHGGDISKNIKAIGWYNKNKSAPYRVLDVIHQDKWNKPSIVKLKNRQINVDLKQRLFYDSKNNPNMDLWKERCKIPYNETNKNI